jgi:hypothetical protein
MGVLSKNAAARRDRNAILQEPTACCAYCVRPFGTDEFSRFSWQHINPRRRGGTNERTNLRPCCQGCNADLAHAWVDECPGALAALRARYGQSRGDLAAVIRRKANCEAVEAVQAILPAAPTLGDVFAGLMERRI